MYPGKISSALVLMVLALQPLHAAAYVGPGLGAGTIGVILGLIGSILLALFAFFWYPIKRALFGKKDAAEEEEQPPVALAEAEPEAARESRDS